MAAKISDVWTEEQTDRSILGFFQALGLHSSPGIQEFAGSPEKYPEISKSLAICVCDRLGVVRTEERTKDITERLIELHDLGQVNKPVMTPTLNRKLYAERREHYREDLRAKRSK